MENIKFYPMSQKPIPDESDASFSRTVIVFGSKSNETGLGYYDFEMKEWLHLGGNLFLLKCWCYLPVPGFEEKNEWEAIAPRGYLKSFF